MAASPDLQSVRRNTRWRSVAVALLLTLMLTAAWTFKDWAQLRILRLPDNDDMMRLAQVRDWVAGQPFNDLMQYRLGPPGGASMHWSRFADMGPALLLLLLGPVLGAHGSAVAMVVLWPAILFFLYLILAGSIARRLDMDGAGTPVLAVVLAALAFPTISLFLPGRIDHHGIQIVLVVALVRLMLARPTLAVGAAGGALTAISLHIGLEAAPELVAIMAVHGIKWIVDPAEDRRAAGYGGALGGMALAMIAVMQPTVWPEIWCDGFTPGSFRAMLVLSAAWGVIAASGRVAGRWPIRLAIGGTVGGASAVLAYLGAPACFGGPYGALHPFLERVWMSNVSEAQDLVFGQDTVGTSLAFGGLCVAGTIVAVARAFYRRRMDDADWAMAVFLGISLIAAILQVRVTYILAGLAAIPVAIAIAGLKGPTRMIPRLALWIVGAGITYNFAGMMLDATAAPRAVAARAAKKACVSGPVFSQMAQLPPGTMMAPIDLGAYVIGMTPHHVVAAPYHRNNSGNLAMYAFFLSRPDRARELAALWGVDYVALCPNIMRDRGLAPYRPGSLVEQLQGDGPAPQWLQPVPVDGGMMLYRVRR